MIWPFVYLDVGAVYLSVKAVSLEVLHAVLDHDDEQHSGQWQHGDFSVENFHGGHPVQNRQEQEIEVGPSGSGEQSVREHHGEENYTLCIISLLLLALTN